MISRKVPRKAIVKKAQDKINLTPMRIGEIKVDTKTLKKNIARMMKIDEIVNRDANGCFTVSPSNNLPRYKAKQLYEYAQVIGKNTSDLNDDELAMFIIDK